MTRRGIVVGHLIVGTYAVIVGAVLLWPTPSHPVASFVNGVLVGVNFTRAAILAKR